MPPGPRIGLYGGAFDPPHAAHLAVARAAIEQLRLDRLLVLPTGGAWHKARTLNAASHRVAMARAAFAGLACVTVDDRETRRSGASFTIDTLRELQATHTGGTWFLVIGEDQARAFQSWKDWRDILSRASVAVAPRGEPGTATGPGAVGQGGAGMIEPLWRDPAHWDGHRVLTLDLPPLPHSATDIRARLASGQAAGDLGSDVVPAAVARYIDQHRLYLNP